MVVAIREVAVVSGGDEDDCRDIDDHDDENKGRMLRQEED